MSLNTIGKSDTGSTPKNRYKFIYLFWKKTFFSPLRNSSEDILL